MLAESINAHDNSNNHFLPELPARFEAFLGKAKAAPVE